MENKSLYMTSSQRDVRIQQITEVWRQSENRTEKIINTAEISNSTGNRSEAGLTYPSSFLSDESLNGLIFLYSLTTFLSIVGNILVVIVFAKGRRSRTDLRFFLINLAAADLIMATFCMPFTFADSMMGRWVFTTPMCPIVLFMQLLSVCGSVFTNMAIGIDRFMAVTFPLHSRITYRRGKYVIIIVWLCSLALSSVQLFIGRTKTHDGRVTCNEQWPYTHSRPIYTIFVLLLTYLMPLLILLITYSIIGILLWRRTAPGNKHHFRDMHQLRSKIKVVKMLVIVVVMFGICWLPLHVFNLLQDFVPQILIYNTEQEFRVLLGVFLGSHWLAMSNSFANPIIYGFTNESFRADLLILLHKWFPCCSCLKSLMIRTYSLSTYDSMIYRRNTTLYRRSSLNNNGSFRGSKHYKSPHRKGSGTRRSSATHKVGTELYSPKYTNGILNHHSFHSKIPSAFIESPE